MQTPPESAAPIRTDTAALGREIVALCTHIHAATYRLLVSIREFDAAGGWHQPGLCSCAHWLNFQCGIGMNAAREKVRVAHALAALPKISAAFGRGELSYSKVRAMTRVANEGNEDYLMMIARHGTAHHVERLVRKYRRAKRLRDCEQANARHAERFLDHYYDADGCLVIRARLPAEQGALIVKALQHALEHEESRDDEGAANRDESAAPETKEPIGARRADALAEVAETYLANPDVTGSSADRYQVVVHVRPELGPGARGLLSGQKPDVGAANPLHSSHGRNVSAAPDVTAEGLSTEPDIGAADAMDCGHAAHIENGPHVTAETSERISCDCARVDVIESSNGEPLSIGRRSRSIPAAIRRALQLRDGGCRFPGCTQSRFVDGHHIVHWSEGGETSLDNLVLLCRRHHRLVHEGGFGCGRKADGEVFFSAPDETRLPDYPPVRRIEVDPFDWFEREIRSDDLGTCVPEWRAGETIDWGLAVGHLMEAESYCRAENQSV